MPSKKVKSIESYKVILSNDAECALQQFINGEITPEQYAKAMHGDNAMTFEKVDDDREFTISWDDEN